MEGTKYDEGKLKWDLLPWEEVSAVVKVLMHGAEKYKKDNWKKVPDAENRYFSAAIRHMLDWENGEGPDDGSGQSHLAHAICNLLYLMWFESREDDNPYRLAKEEIDDVLRKDYQQFYSYKFPIISVSPFTWTQS